MKIICGKTKNNNNNSNKSNTNRKMNIQLCVYI